MLHSWYAHDQEHALSGPGVNISLNYQANHGIQTCYRCWFLIQKTSPNLPNRYPETPSYVSWMEEITKTYQNCDPWYPYVYQDVDGFWITSLKVMMSKNVLRESEFRMLAKLQKLVMASESFWEGSSTLPPSTLAQGRHVQEPDGSWDLCSGWSSSELSRASWRWQICMGNGVFYLQNEEHFGSV